MAGPHARIGSLEAVVAGIFLVGMVLLIFSGGVARALGHPLNWTTDVATCLFAWSCFLSADLAWRANGMMAIDVVTDRLPERLRSALVLVNYLLIVAFLLYLAGFGLYLSWISRIRSFQGIPGVSYSLVTASLPVGSLLLLSTTILKIRAHLRGERETAAAVDVI